MTNPRICDQLIFCEYAKSFNGMCIHSKKHKVKGDCKILKNCILSSIYRKSVRHCIPVDRKETNGKETVRV